MKQKTGLDLRNDVLSWMGNAGVYVAGTSTSDLRGALVVASSDTAKTKRTIDALEKLARASNGTHVTPLSGGDGFTIQEKSGPPVHVALSGDKFVVAVGPKSVIREAASPSAKLGSSATFTGAASKLGNGLRPSFFLDFPRIVNLIEAFAGSQADFQKAKPYLDTFGPVVAGAKDEGSGVTRTQFVVTLR
jgi:hypothetical protein